MARNAVRLALFVAALTLIHVPVLSADTSQAQSSSGQGALQRQIDELRKLVEAQRKEIDELKKKVGDSPSRKEPAKPAVTTAKQRINFYGFLRTDVLHDSQATFANNQCPMYVESPDKPGVGKGAERFALYPRVTRFGFDFTAPESEAKWKLGGKMEMDFQSGGPESRPMPRARLAYLQANRGAFSVLGGLQWDLIAPLFPSPADDSIMWNTGNLGDRHPQLRLTWDRIGSPTTAAFALGLTGAVDAKDLDGNGTRDGEESGVPSVQARMAVRGKWGQVGVWGMAAQEKVAAPVAGKTHFDSGCIGADVKIPLSPKAELTGEIWTGKNLPDIRGGIMQGVNTATGKEIESSGGWLELGYRTSSKHRIAFGYSIDDPQDGDIAANGRTRNYAYWLHNKWTIMEPLDLGVNLLYWTTDYKGMRSGKDLRINVFAAYRF